MRHLLFVALVCVMVVSSPGAKAQSDVEAQWRTILGDEVFDRTAESSKGFLSEFRESDNAGRALADALVVAEYQRLIRWLDAGEIVGEARREAEKLLNDLETHFLRASERTIRRAQTLATIIARTRPYTKEQLFVVRKSVDDDALLRLSLAEERRIIPLFPLNDQQFSEYLGYDGGVELAAEMLSKDDSNIDDAAAKAIEQFSEKYFDRLDREKKANVTKGVVGIAVGCLTLIANAGIPAMAAWSIPLGAALIGGGFVLF